VNILDLTRKLLEEEARPTVDQNSAESKIVSGGGIAVICKCGHVADLFDFSRTEISGELPDNEIQCPACKRAVRKTWSGLQPIGARL